MTLTAEGFVRSAFRMPVEIKGSLVRTARREYRSFCKVLETKRVYSRFELDPNGVLQCVFSQEPGLLLGETVRDWLWKAVEHAEDSPLNFLWCEKFGESEFALVWVHDGRIRRETFATPRMARIEVEQLIRRGRVYDPDIQIFLYGLDLSEVGLAEDQAILMLDRSVLESGSQTRQDLPRLSSFGSAISRIAGTSKLGWILSVIVALGVLLVAYYYGDQWFRPTPSVPVAEVIPDSTNQEALVQEYNDLLLAGSPGEIIQSLHSAIERFLTDSTFGAYWLIEEVQWQRGDSRLQIQAILQKGESPPEDEGEALSVTRQIQLRRAAEARGWTLVIDRFNGTFQIPVEWYPRSQEKISDLTQVQPVSTDHTWHFERLAAEMKLIGILEKDEGNSNNSVYHTEALVLKFFRDPWPTGETARWLSQRLDGGPLSLDAVSLKSVPNGAGVFMDGMIKFRLVWRNSDSSPYPSSRHTRALSTGYQQRLKLPYEMSVYGELESKRRMS